MKFRHLFISMVIAGLCLGGLSSVPAQAQVGIGITIGTPPPPLPVYDQPEIPGPGYIWTPGYWAWNPDVSDYYWVPGVWVMPPQIGFLWTPAWWGWSNGGYCYHGGYWGTHVGFYGGVNYGHGYWGNGYQGGRWNNGHFYYNRSANNFGNVRVNNVYNERVNYRHSNISYNGGHGGINARPTAEQQRFDRESHIGATSEQNRHVQTAASEKNLRYSANHGRPDVTATSRAGEFNRSATVNNNTVNRSAEGLPNKTETVNPSRNNQFNNTVHNDRVKSTNVGQQKTEPKVEHHNTQPAPSNASMVHHQEHQAPVTHQSAPVEHHASAPVQHQSVQHFNGGGGGGHSNGGGHPSGGGGGHPSGGGGHSGGGGGGHSGGGGGGHGGGNGHK